MSSLVPETGWAQGASGGPDVFDTSPAGLGLSPAYLASASASASSSTTTSGTIFPATPADGNIFIYTASSSAGVKWAFQYDSTQATYKWVCVGGLPLWSEVTAADARANAAYGALTNPGPSVILPFAGDYDVAVGFTGNVATANEFALMSYDIGGTGALDADGVELTSTQAASGNLYDYIAVSRPRRKTGLTAITLTSKYRTGGGSTTFKMRWMSVMPVRVSG